MHIFSNPRQLRTRNAPCLASFRAFSINLMALPTLAEVQSYVAERHSAVDPQGFIDFYAAKGWLVGKAPMRDWKAACRNAESWERWAKQPNNNRVRTSDEYAKGADFFG